MNGEGDPHVQLVIPDLSLLGRGGQVWGAELVKYRARARCVEVVTDETCKRC